MSSALLSGELQIAEEINLCYEDPLRFVALAFPWGKLGPLKDYPGPDAWQREFLEAIGVEVRRNHFDGRHAVPAIRRAVSSGHGVGKSTLAAWLVCWIMSTRPHAQGTITANTYTQLETKTWAAIKRWMALCITSHWFETGDQRMYHKDHKDSWFCSPQSSKEENSEAFAGQHAVGSSSFYIFDEDCHDDRTEVLTEAGWKLFKDVQPGERLLTMDPETGKAEYEQPTHLHVAPYDGEMVVYERRGASFRVTPHHRMLGRRMTNGKLGKPMFVEAGSLRNGFYIPRRFDWPELDQQTFTIPAFRSARKDHPARTVTFDAWAEFLGWYCSEGHLVKRMNAEGETEYTGVGITNRDLARPKALLEAMGFRPLEYSAVGRTANQLMVNDRALAEYLAQFGIGAIKKRVPLCIRQASARQIDLFLGSMVEGDGYQKTAQCDVIYTSSSGLASDLQELIVKAGYQAFVTKRRLAGMVANFGTHQTTMLHDGYVVERSRIKADIRIRPEYLRREHYKGIIYCATVPKNGVLFTRRDGKCMWSGNSGISDGVHEVAEGGLTDGEPMIFLFGNCTRITGNFYRSCFGAQRDRWAPIVVDSRRSSFTNKDQINEWIELYGEDSDFVRVRVRGLAPRASDAQFIDQDRVVQAQKRQVVVLEDEPLVAGVDLAWGGEDDNVVRFRRGADGRSIPPIRIKGEFTRDPAVMVNRLSDILTKGHQGRQVHTLFLDSAGIAGPVGARLRQLGFRNVQEVNFGADSPDIKCRFMRDYIWQEMKQWLLTAAIDKDPQLEADLCGPGVLNDLKQRVWLESKKDMKARGLASPDDGDALALTFAHKVAPPRVRKDGAASLPKNWAWS